ncbi:MAG: peptide chain release factor N(5)-glutamine methyltransferase [Actinomycetota bacterium]|nr:peptide chain release factor N(5)-glutamine methyltransferase [Actinomycetota bacterium]
MTRGAVSAREAVRSATRKLAAAGIPEPEASAQFLLAELLGVGRVDLMVRDLVLTDEQRAVYKTWISRRRAREPVQRILGYAYFRNLKLNLNHETLIPRPDTESVVEAALECIDRLDGGCRVLDIGTGSGAIAVSIAQERPGCEVHASDTSEAALRLACRNAADASVEVRFHRTDLVSNLDDLNGNINLLVSNPPYIRTDDIPALAPEVRDWDPPDALDGGPDGLKFYRRIFAETPPLLRSGAYLVLEVGDGQAADVLGLGRRAGFVPLGEHSDLTGTPRAVVLRWRTE